MDYSPWSFRPHTYKIITMRTEKEKLYLTQLANKIALVRKEKGISQEELANIAQIDRSYMSKIERAAANPTYLTLLQISQGLKVSIYEILPE